MSWQVRIAQALSVAVVCALALAVPTGRIEASAASLPADHPDGTILSKYCFTCHNDKRKVGGLVLENKDLTHVGPDAETWEKVVRKLRMGSMPPPGMPRPDLQTTDNFVTALENKLDEEAALHPNPGRTQALHRLNRAEYANAVRDLLGLDVDTATFLPPDDADTQGLDNNASLLSVSPALLERYLIVARRVSRLALGLPPAGPVIETFKAPKLSTQEVQGEGLPFGTRGGAAIDYTFPADGQYLIKVRLRRQLYDYVDGLQEAEQLDVRIDGKPVKLFKVGGENHGLTAAESFAGEIYGGSDWETWALNADAGLQLRMPITAGPHVVAVSFLRSFLKPEDALTRSPGVAGHLASDETPTMALDSVSISGPYDASDRGEDTPSLRKVLTCRPKTSAEEEPCARKILSSLARQAYRRPVSAREVQTLMEFYRDGRKDGDFKTGVQVALSRILTSPNFLFRVEQDPPHAVPGKAYRISDLELASRLSFFLWSSIPDKTLLDLASEEPAASAGGAGRAGQTDDRRSAVQGPGGQLRRPVAAAAQHQERRAGSAYVPCVRRGAARVDGTGNHPVRERPDPPQPQRGGAFERPLHLPQRASGPALRRSRRRRHADAAGRPAAPTARAGACWARARCRWSPPTPTAPRRCCAASGCWTAFWAPRRLSRRPMCRR